MSVLRAGNIRAWPLSSSIPNASESSPTRRPSLATYEKLDKQNKYSLWFRVGNLKTAAGREKKIAAFVKMLRRGEKLHPPK